MVCSLYSNELLSLQANEKEMVFHILQKRHTCFLDIIHVLHIFLSPTFIFTWFPKLPVTPCINLFQHQMITYFSHNVMCLLECACTISGHDMMNCTFTCFSPWHIAHIITWENTWSLVKACEKGSLAVTHLTLLVKMRLIPGASAWKYVLGFFYFLYGLSLLKHFHEWYMICHAFS